MTREFRFPSGLRMVYNEMPNTRSVSFGVFVRAGSEYEVEENNGISHFMEHMMFKGTSKRTAFQIADQMESIGARMNAYTSKNLTAYYTVSLDEHLEDCMEMISDILFSSLYDEKEIEKEKKVVIEEIQMSEDDPEDLCFDKLFAAWYGDMGPGRRILGEKETINSFTRQGLIDFRCKEYYPENMVISVAGRFDFKKAQELVYKFFELNAISMGIKSWKTIEFDPIVKSIITVKPLEQANIAFAFKGINLKDERNMALNMVSNLFGGGMSSRLFQSIRETMGLAYNVYSAPYSFSNSGIFAIYLGTSPEKAKTATSEIGRQIKIVREKGFSLSEFNKSKEQIKTSLVLSLESSSAIMRIAGQRALLKNELFDSDVDLSYIKGLTIEKLNDITEYVFSEEKIAVSYVGREPKYDIKEELLYNN